MKKLILAAILATSLASCAQPLPPCPDEACVEQRQENAMMLLGVMAAQEHQQQQQQQQDDPMQYTPTNQLQDEVLDLQNQVQQLQQNQPN